MPKENISSGGKVVDQFAQKTLLGRSIEVNDDVATENDIKGFLEAEVRCHEVQPAKTHHGAQLRDNANLPHSWIFGFEQVSLLQGGII